MKTIYLYLMSGMLVVIAIGAILFAFFRQSKTAILPPNQTFTALPTAAPSPSSPVSEALTDREANLTLTVLEPKNNQVVSSPQITVMGKTAAGADVFINEEELAADSQGNFSAVLTLEEEENYLTVVAIDEDGNYNEQEVIVTLQSP